MDDLSAAGQERAALIASFVSEGDSIVVIETDPGGRITAWSRSWSRIVGAEDHLGGMPIGDLFEFPERMLEEVLREGEPQASPVILLRIKGCNQIVRGVLRRTTRGLLQIAERMGTVEDLESLLRRADEALYLAKERGRDQVVVAQAPSGSRAPIP